MLWVAKAEVSLVSCLLMHGVVCPFLLSFFAKNGTKEQQTKRSRSELHVLP